MAQDEPGGPPLNPYERAACYYTLPRVAPPLSARFVFIFGGLLGLLLTVLCIVAVFASSVATYAMVMVVMVTALVGIFVAMLQTLINEIRTRRVLYEASTAPQTRTQDDTLPDPFAKHVLLRHPGNSGGKLSTCTSANDGLEYVLDNARNRALWEVRTPGGEPVLTVQASGGAGSFAFVSGQAGRFVVRVGEKEVARIKDGGTLLKPQVDVMCHTPVEQLYAIRNGGIFRGERLVGRVYYVHDAHYLDIEREHLNEGILGYFVSLI